jgi:hypothetical protein
VVPCTGCTCCSCVVPRHVVRAREGPRSTSDAVGSTCAAAFWPSPEPSISSQSNLEAGYVPLPLPLPHPCPCLVCHPVLPSSPRTRATSMWMMHISSWGSLRRLTLGPQMVDIVIQKHHQPAQAVFSSPSPSWTWTHHRSSIAFTLFTGCDSPPDLQHPHQQAPPQPGSTYPGRSTKPPRADWHTPAAPTYTRSQHHRAATSSGCNSGLYQGHRRPRELSGQPSQPQTHKTPRLTTLPLPTLTRPYPLCPTGHTAPRRRWRSHHGAAHITTRTSTNRAHSRAGHAGFRWASTATNSPERHPTSRTRTCSSSPSPSSPTRTLTRSPATDPAPRHPASPQCATWAALNSRR